MIPTVPQSAFSKWCYRAYVTVFFIYLALPLTIVCVFVLMLVCLFCCRCVFTTTYIYI